MEKTPLFQSAPAKVNLENVIRKQRVWDISHLLANCYRAFREFKVAEHSFAGGQR